MSTSNPETVVAQPSKYYGEAQKKYYLAHPVKIQKTMSDYYQANKEHIKKRRLERYYQAKRVAALQAELDAMYVAAVTPALTHTEVFSS